LTIACNQDISRVEGAFVNLKENLANFSNKDWMLEITCNQNISSKLKGFFAKLKENLASFSYKGWMLESSLQSKHF
jgi:hypothetical protein